MMRGLLMLITMLVMPAVCFAEVSDLSEFNRIAVLDSGRVKPMSSYAEHKLLQFSGRSRLGDVSASEWMAQLLFTPDVTRTNRIFLVNHPEVLQAVGLDVVERDRYAFADLQEHLGAFQQLARDILNIEEEARAESEKEILQLYYNLTDYTAHCYAFAFAEPHPDFSFTHPDITELLEIHHSPASFYDVWQYASKLSVLIEDLTAMDPEEWTPLQQEAFTLSRALFRWSQLYRNMPVTILPVSGHDEEMWASPWDVLGLQVQDSGVLKETELLQDAVRAYRGGDQEQFNVALAAFNQSVRAREPALLDAQDLALELAYNRGRYFSRAKWFYGLSFLCALLCATRRRRLFVGAALVSGLIAFGLHSTGLVMRMLIMDRPPVTNLYATFIFVGWVAVLLGGAMEALRRNGLGLLVGSFTALTLLLVSGRFATESDTMGVMIAVLDSNFWLATHVVCITTGYAGCVVAGVLGHIYLIKALWLQDNAASQRQLQQSIYGTLAFGLTLSFLGTMLGGVWADQSWGRFWGWDPKENGALVIVLWSAILFHARMGGMVGPRGFAAGAILGNVGVLAAWLGVNLLGVGLHSYGFISGLGLGFFAACSFEMIFTVVFLLLGRRTESAA